MPRYHPTKAWIFAGKGQHVVSLNKRDGKKSQVVASHAGESEWLTTDECVYVQCIGVVAGKEVYGIFAHNGVKARQIGDGGATNLYAGGGVWAAHLGPAIRSNAHPSFSGGLVGVGPDGTLAFRRTFQPGTGLVLRSKTGKETEIVKGNVVAHDVQVLSAAGALWMQGGRLKCTLGDPVTVEGSCGSPRRFIHNGVPLLLYFVRDSVGERLVLQTEWDKPVGIVLAEGKTIAAHRPDGVSFKGEVLVCYSETQAEGPSSIVEVPIALSDAKPLARSPSVPVPVPVPPPVIPKPEPMPIPNYLHVVQAARAKYAHLSGPERAYHIVRQVALDLKAEGAGMFYKTGGNQYNERSIDVLIFAHREGDPAGKGQTYDILKNAENTAEAIWTRTQPTGYGDIANWRAVVITEPTPPVEPPPPLPPPPPATPPTDAVLAALKEIQAQLAELRVEVNEIADMQDEQNDALAEAVEKLSKPRPVTLTAKYLGTMTGEVGAAK